MTLEKATSRVKFYQILHQTMVELLILKDMSKPLTDGCNILGYEDSILSIINQVEVKPSIDLTTATLTFPSEEAKTTIYEWFSQLYQGIEDIAEAAAEEIAFDVESAQTEEIAAEQQEALLAEAEQDDMDTKGPTPYRPNNLDFLAISLADSEFKFAVSSLKCHLLQIIHLFSERFLPLLFSILTDRTNTNENLQTVPQTSQPIGRLPHPGPGSSQNDQAIATGQLPV